MIRVRAEAGAGIAERVGGYHVGVLACELGTRVFEHVFGLHGEAADELTAPFVRAEPLQNVSRAAQLQGQICAVGGFFDFFSLGFSRRIIRHSGGHHKDVGAFKAVRNRLKHLLCALHRHHLDERRRRDAHRTADERDLGAAQHRLTRDGVAHLAGGVIGDKAHRIKALARGSCCDQHAFACQILWLGNLAEDIVEQGLLGGQLAGADSTAGEHAVVGRYDGHAAAREDLEVVLHRRILKHVYIHRRRDQHRRLYGKKHSAEHVVGDAVRELSDDICRGRRYQHDVGTFRQGDVLDLTDVMAVKGLGVTAAFGERFKGDGRDKLRRVLCHHDLHMCVELDEHARQIGDFVGGYAAGHAEQHGFSFQHMVHLAVVV